MRQRCTLLLLVTSVALLLSSCEQTSVANQEQIRSFETIQALTPTVTQTPPATNTPLPTATPSPTAGPSPTALPPTATLVPSPTALPPTATPNPALQAFSTCLQQAGDTSSGRFSARITTITTTVEAAFERLVIGLDVPADTQAPYAVARCVPDGDQYAIQVDLEGWLQDKALTDSLALVTKPFSGTKVLSGMQVRQQPDTPSGVSLILPVSEPRPFRLALETNPYRLILEVASIPALGPASDVLAIESKGNTPDEPIFYLQAGDIWRYADGKAKNLTNSPEVETAFSSSQSGRMAFCRMISAPGDAIEVSSLWVMERDGSNQQELADAGRSCADPVISPDGKKIAFTVDEDATGVQPARLSIWMIDLPSGQSPDRLTSPGSVQAAGRQPTPPDEWSRFGPQWLGNDKLVYVAQAEDGRSTLFTLTVADRKEIDVGAALLITPASNDTGSVARYAGFGRPLASPDGQRFAVEALRIDKPGADLLVLDATGREQGIPPNDAYWSRPLAFGSDGTLYTLTSACQSEATQTYALLALSAKGPPRTIGIGQTGGSFGAFAAVGNGVAYVTLAAPGAAGLRGPLNYTGAGASALWFWDGQSGRSRLVEAPDPIRAVGP